MLFQHVINTGNLKEFTFFSVCTRYLTLTAQLRSDQAHVKGSRGTSGYCTRQCRAVQCFPVIHKPTAHDIDAECH